MSPCHNCKDRKPYCHSTCDKEDYIKFEDKKKKIKRNEQKANFIKFTGGTYGL